MSSAAPSTERGDDFGPPPELERSRVRRSLLTLVLIIVLVVSVITLVPGLESFRERLSNANAAWLGVGAVLKLLSGLCYVAVFRSVFCSSMSWRHSSEIGMSELGANAVVPTGGAGGLALGAWALHRGGMDGERIARRSVAFFFLTSVPNVLGVIIISIGLALGVFSGRAGIALTVVPAVIATGAIVVTIAGGRWAAVAGRRRSASSGAGSRAARALRALSGGVEEALELLRRADPWLVVGLVGYLAFDVMILWAGFRAFGATPPLAIIWIAYLIGELGGLDTDPGRCRRGRPRPDRHARALPRVPRRRHCRGPRLPYDRAGRPGRLRCDRVRPAAPLAGARGARDLELRPGRARRDHRQGQRAPVRLSRARIE